MKHSTDNAIEALALQVEQAFPGKTFTLSTGRGYSDGFIAREVGAAELVRQVAGVTEGNKGDGARWSHFAWRNGRRLSANASRADLLILDSDKGASRFEIEDALKREGLAGLIVPSSSHGKRTTKIKAAPFDSWRAAIVEIEGPDADTRVARFLEMEGHLIPAVAKTARETGRHKETETKKTTRGKEIREVEYVDTEHAPCPKFRVVLFLAKPWIVAEHGTSSEAQKVWENAYLATLDLLGLDLDETSADVSRLFYETRVPATMLDVARRERCFLSGRAFDPFALGEPKPRIRQVRYRKRPGKPATATGSSDFDGLWTRPDGSTRNLRAWAAENGDKFRIIDALLDTSRPERRAIVLDDRGERNGRLHIECPFHDEHSSTKGGGTYVSNPGTGRNRGSTVKCQHHACLERDRLEFYCRMLDDGTLLENDFRSDEFGVGETDATPSTPEANDNGNAERPNATPNQGNTATKSLFDGIEPLDLFADDGLAGKPDLPAGLLPGVIEDFARDVAERLGVEAGMPAASCLAALAGALHDGYVIQPRQLDTEWTESARLWIQVVADPGVGKTPAIEPALRPLRGVEHDWIKEDTRKRAAYEIALEEHKKRIKKGTDKAAGLAPGEDSSRLWAEVEPPQEPEFRRVFVDDLTTEALAGILKTNPRGVLSSVDELSGWLGAFDAYRSGTTGKDRPIWLRAFQGGRYTIDRATRGHIVVENMSVSILGGIQPEKLRQLAAKGGLADDGLLQRFLTVWGRRTGSSIDRRPDDAAARYWRELLEGAAAARPVDFDTTRVLMTPAASEVFESVLRWSGDLCALPSTSPAFRGHLSKWGALYARLVLILHAAESFDLSGRLLERVGVDTAERARALLLKFFLPHSAALYREIVGTGAGGTQHGEWIAGFILAHGLERVSLRDLRRAYRDLRDDEDATRRAMRPLEFAGWALPVERSNGKPPQEWVINPAAHRVFGQRAAAEKARREAERAKIQAIAGRMAELST